MTVHSLDTGQDLEDFDGNLVTDPTQRHGLFTLLADSALNALRDERNTKLKDTDWWANSDITMTAEQMTYRQALRDITGTYSSPNDVVWPTKPS